MDIKKLYEESQREMDYKKLYEESQAEIVKLKKENETNQIEVLQIKFDVWRECMCQFDPQYSVDDEIAFLRDNTDDETIVKKLFDKHYEENGWVYNLETHDYDDTEWEKFKQEISLTL